MNVSYSVFYYLMSVFCVLLWHDYLSITNYNIWQFSHPQPYGKLMDQWNVLHHLTQVTPSCSCNSNTTPTSTTSCLMLSHPVFNTWVCGVFKNLYLFHYFLWAHPIWFLPTFPRKQLGHKTRAIYIWFSYLWSWCLLGSTAAHQTN